MEYTTKINIGGVGYELLLTTGATKAIAKRYGGLEELGTKLMDGEKYDAALDELVWLIALLANQSIRAENLRSGSSRALLTEDEIELFTTPADLIAFKDAFST